jgi:hypothetical protein
MNWLSWRNLGIAWAGLLLLLLFAAPLGLTGLWLILVFAVLIATVVKIYSVAVADGPNV